VSLSSTKMSMPCMEQGSLPALRGKPYASPSKCFTCRLYKSTHQTLCSKSSSKPLARESVVASAVELSELTAVGPLDGYVDHDLHTQNVMKLI
jgi:hypothetical protein